MNFDLETEILTLKNRNFGLFDRLWAKCWQNGLIDKKNCIIIFFLIALAVIKLELAAGHLAAGRD